MLYGEAFHANLYSEPHLGKCVCGAAHSFSRSEPMLWAGLKDKKDNFIFEGDIVKREGGIEPIFRVVWNEQRASFMLQPYMNGQKGIWHYDKEELEIIGNIHENPDLVPKGKIIRSA